MKNLQAFMDIYRAALADAVAKHPDEYAWPLADVPVVAARMEAAIVRGSYNHDGRAFKATCKALGIKHTRKAIGEYLNR